MTKPELLLSMGYREIPAGSHPGEAYGKPIGYNGVSILIRPDHSISLASHYRTLTGSIEIWKVEEVEPSVSNEELFQAVIDFEAFSLKGYIGCAPVAIFVKA